MPSDDLPSHVPGERTTVETNGVALHCVEAGSEQGPLVVLLHGFPECWYGWNEVVAPLVSRGYHVVVPDQRGYNRSEKPAGVDAYHVDELAGDVAGLVDAYGREDARIVGHDWGAFVGWWLALHQPRRVSHLVAVNVPHPTVMYETLRRSWAQRLRSWYIAAFQLPWLPERLAGVRDWAPLVRGMRRSSSPGTFSRADFERYRRAWGREGAFTAMVNWYRAVGRHRPTPGAERVVVPTKVIWGARDQFLDRSMARRSVDRCAEGYLCMFDDATHWVQHEFPARVAAEIHEHVAPTSMTTLG